MAGKLLSGWFAQFTGGANFRRLCVLATVADSLAREIEGPGVTDSVTVEPALLP